MYGSTSDSPLLSWSMERRVTMAPSAESFPLSRARVIRTVLRASLTDSPPRAPTTLSISSLFRTAASIFFRRLAGGAKWSALYRNPLLAQLDDGLQGD